MRSTLLGLPLLSLFLITAGAARAQTAHAIYRPETARTAAAQPALATFAVAKMYTHGASFTCVYTAKDRSVFLGCAHAFEGADARKPISFDAPAPVTSPQPINAQPRLTAVDYQADLSIVEVAYGPMPYVMPIAPPGHQPGSVLACGYDKMQSLVRAPATIRTAYTYTVERPIPGRSGGALCDASAGLLIGVCHGYEVTGPRRGMYVSHGTILTFVAQKGYGWLVTAGSPDTRPGPVVGTPVPPHSSALVNIPTSCWVPNQSGSACAWSAIETLARFHGLTRLNGLAAQHPGTTGPGGPESVLRQQSVRCYAQGVGSSQALARQAVDAGLGAMVGLGGQHCMVLVGYDEQDMVCLDNCPCRLVRVPWSRFDGWAVVVLPDGADQPHATPHYRTQPPAYRAAPSGPPCRT